MGGACGAFRILVGKSEGKKTLGIHKWDGMIILRLIFKK